MYSEQSSVLGIPVGRMADVSRWFLTQPHGEYSEHDIANVIVPTYWALCVDVIIDPVLVLAQLAVETTETIDGKRGPLQSFWSRRRWRFGQDTGDLRNPAGIGVNGEWSVDRPGSLAGWAFNDQRGRWEKGCAFATWSEDAIPAHVGRLVAYATSPMSRTAKQRDLVAKALGYRDLPRHFHGTAPILRQLGKACNPMGAQGCGWASPGREYGDHIARVANEMMGW